MNLTEKAAYIKGLAEGLNLDKTTKEGKILDALMELANDLAQEVAGIREDIKDIDEDMEYLNEYVEELDDDLQAVEDFLDEDVDPNDDDDDFDDEDCDGNCDDCDGCADEEFYEIVCPSCGDTVCFDGELDPESLVCPACGEKFGCIVDEEDFKKLSE